MVDPEDAAAIACDSVRNGDPCVPLSESLPLVATKSAPDGTG